MGLGGCNGKVANVVVLGSATTANHNFRIERDAQSVFRFFLDGGQLAINISQNDPRIACWAAGDRSADWYMEKADRGNGFADKTPESQFDALSYKIMIWNSLTASSKCLFGGNDFCTDYADGDFDGWTDNGGTLAATDDNNTFTVRNPESVGLPWR